MPANCSVFWGSILKPDARHSEFEGLNQSSLYPRVYRKIVSLNVHELYDNLGHVSYVLRIYSTVIGPGALAWSTGQVLRIRTRYNDKFALAPHDSAHVGPRIACNPMKVPFCNVHVLYCPNNQIWGVYHRWCSEEEMKWGKKVTSELIAEMRVPFPSRETVTSANGRP